MDTHSSPPGAEASRQQAAEPYASQHEQQQPQQQPQQQQQQPTYHQHHHQQQPLVPPAYQPHQVPQSFLQQPQLHSRRPLTGPITSRHPAKPSSNANRSGTLLHPQDPPSDSAVWTGPKQGPNGSGSQSPPVGSDASTPNRPTVPRSAIFQRAPDGRQREVSWGAADDAARSSYSGGSQGRGVAFSGPLGFVGARKATFLDAHARRTGKQAEDEASVRSSMQASVPHSPALSSATPRSGILTKSIIMCMDPTCNSCPPEMHLYRNMRMLSSIRREAAEEQSEGAKGEEHLEEPELALPDEFDIFDDELESEDGDLEGSKRMVIRFCGIPIVAYKSAAGRHGKSRVPGWLRWCRFAEAFSAKVPVFNPHSRFMHEWTKWFVSASLLGFFIDPLFFFIFGIMTDPPAFLCMTVNWTLALSLCLARFLVDLWYFAQILITFRTAYVVPSPSEKASLFQRKDPSGMAPGEMVFDTKFIAQNYLWSPTLVIDVMCAIPLPQIIILAILPAITGSWENAGHDVNIKVAIVLLALLAQAVPRIFRLFHQFKGAAAISGSLFESAWATFLLNLSYYLMVSHIVGAVWYLFCVERVSECLVNECNSLGSPQCSPEFLYCPKGSASEFFSGKSLVPLNSTLWGTSAPASLCLSSADSPLDYGIFQSGIQLTLLSSFFQKYFSSLYWGFQQVSTMSGNQSPSPWIPEVIFILLVATTGLLLLAVLIGSMSNFLQALSRRSFEYQMNCRDVELWMHRRNIPPRLQKKVKNLLRLQWATTKGVEDIEVLRLLTEDLQRDLRSKLCDNLLTASPLFKAMKQGIPKVLDAFCERLQQRIYIEGTEIVKEGYPVTRLFFILKGSVSRFSTRTMDLGQDMLGRGDFLGEELLIHYLDRITRSSDRSQAQGRSIGRSLTRSASQLGIGMSRGEGDGFEDAIPSSGYTAFCVGPVEGYSLDVADVVAVCKQHSRQLLDPRVMTALNQCSRRRRVHFARTIQLAWRRYLRRKHKWTLKEVVEAAQQRRVAALPRGESSEAQPQDQPQDQSPQ